MLDSSMASTIPKIVRMIAEVFMNKGIVIGRVFVGVVYDVISNPAVILPNARRVTGLMMFELFSLIGIIVGIRANPVRTSDVIRRL